MIELLLQESVAAARHREVDACAAVLEQCRRGVLLYGAGALGKKVLRALSRAGIEVLGFIDNSSELHTREIEGIRVFSPQSAVERWGASALYVICVFSPGAEGGVRARWRELAQLGCLHITTFLPLGWGLEGILPHYGADLPSRILQHSDALTHIYGRLGDEVSRAIFSSQLRWRLRAEFDEERPSHPQYFPRDLISPNSDETFVDCGAFDGDTLRAVPWPVKRAWAIEPDPKNAAKLLRSVDQARVLVHQVALGDKMGLVRFAASGTMASSCDPEGSVEVKVETLDHLLAHESPTFIKLDVEGDELRSLAGARGVLARARPTLAVCLYHKPDDLWTIPLFVEDILSEHQIALRVHAWNGFELVLYAIAPSRIPNRT